MTKKSPTDARIKELEDTLILQKQAWDSYTEEMNPSGKMRAAADWGLINRAWMALDKAIRGVKRR